MRRVVWLQVINLHINAEPVGSSEIGLQSRPHFGGTQHKLAGSDLFRGNMLDLVGKNQRTGFELVVLIAGHGQAIVHGANVSALHVFNHQIQAIQTRAQRHGLLINRLQLQRLLIEGIGEIATDGVFKSLHDAAGERGNAPENVDDGGVDAFLGLEGKLSVGNLHGNRD